MKEQDRKLMNDLLENPDDYKVIVDNDSVDVYYSYGEGDKHGSFSEIGYYLLNDVFQFLGIDSELV